MTYVSRPSVVVLSRGSTWNPRPFDPPYTLPTDVVGGVWPTATAQAIFYDNAGGVLGVVSGTVAPGGITFLGTPAVVDLIPNGANFEIIITVAGAPYQIRYGKVIRREAEFLLSSAPAAVGQLFSDSWPTTGIRSSWTQMAATSTVVHDNSGVSLANGVSGPNGAASDCAMRWFQPLDGDSFKVKITALNQHSYANSSFSRMRVIGCSDVNMTSYLVAEFLASANSGGTHIDQILFATGTGPTTISGYVGSPVSHVVADNDSITVGYDEGSDTLSVYLGTSLTPAATWVSTGIPHGPGHRYLALAWSTSASTDGLQTTTWQASDEL